VDEPQDEPRGSTSPPTELGPGSLEAERHRLQVRVPAFQGPLDLLLHLVRINEVEIKDLPVLEIARQYDAYLETMRQLDLTIAGEFLVMAATLAHIKSRMLLPRRPSEEVEDEDPRQDLVRQLLEHQRFQLAAESLAARADRQDSVWTRPPHPPPEMNGEVLVEASLYDLLRAFQGVVESLGGSGRLDLRPEGVSVNQRMSEILERLDLDGSTDLSRFLPAGSERRDWIVTFLAILELLRLQLIGAWQVRRFGEIRLAKAAPLPAPEG
jgi:segregation and condensation protein A